MDIIRIYYDVISLMFFVNTSMLLYTHEYNSNIQVGILISMYNTIVNDILRKLYNFY